MFSGGFSRIIRFLGIDRTAQEKMAEGVGQTKKGEMG
jgi:hypothetical protein